MITLKEASWIASSPDGVSLIDAAGLEFSGYSGDEEALASVEVKTSVAASSLSGAVSNAAADIIKCDLGDATFRQYVPEAHMAQVIQQMIVLSTLFAVYVSASETGIMFVLVIRGFQPRLDAWKQSLLSTDRPLVEWAHESATATVPGFADAGAKDLLESGVKFWRLINGNVLEHGPLPPVKVFKHGIQSLYSKTKGGVDGNAQARTIVRSTTISPKWEQKLVTQTFKTLAVNAFVSYRLHQKVDLLQSQETFRGISAFRGAMNSVQSLGDFIYDVSPDLLAHSDRLGQEARAREVATGSAGDPEDALSNAEVARLSSLASSSKRCRL
jgi:hypothetical protein